MPQYSKQSTEKLATCDLRLVEVFMEAIKHFDHTILEGHRDEATQNRYFAEGKSQKKWPNGEHNKLPSLAIDAAPVPIDWKDRERFTYFAGLIKGIATMKGIKIRWGGDWDQDTQVNDNDFDDLVHFEIKDA